MPVPRHAKLNEFYLSTRSPSVGATPVAVAVLVPRSARAFFASLVLDGTITGTAIVTVTNTTTGVVLGTFTVAAGGTGTGGYGDLAGDVNEGDIVTFTDTGAAGATIEGVYTLGARG